VFRFGDVLSWFRHEGKPRTREKVRDEDEHKGEKRRAGAFSSLFAVTQFLVFREFYWRNHFITLFGRYSTARPKDTVDEGVLGRVV
jgi:hypothetical protein